MEINKIGSTDNIQQTNKLQKAQEVSQVTPATPILDKVHFSESAKAQALYKKAMAIIKETPDIRMDKVEEAKKLLESLSNPSDEMLEEVSRKLLGEFGIG